MVTMKFSPVRIDEKPAMNTPIDAEDDMAVGIHGRERRVEGPAGVDAADEQGVEHEGAAEHEQIPAQEIEPRKCQVARADHQRHEEIAERVGIDGMRKNHTITMPCMVNSRL